MNINSKQFDITIECGADFSLNMAIRNSEDALVDLTGCTVSAQLREYPEASDYIAFTATHNGEGGKITLSMAHESTAQIGYAAGYYDCFITFPNTSVQKVLWGEVTVIPAVTKPIDGTVMILLSFGSESAFPLSGLVDRIYFSHASSKMYRWNGTGYVGIRTEMEWDDINNKPETFPPSEHNHDDRYYQKSTINTLLSVKANVGDSYTKDEDDTLLADKADADDVYTKAETDTLLDDKANTADLGSMSAEDTADYYDKTVTDALLADKADIIHTSASGSLVSIHDGAPYPVDSLTVGIEPVQDLHGYDNPWPAGGGKNKFDKSIINQLTANGIEYSIQLLPNTKYTMSTSHPLAVSRAAFVFFKLAGESDSTSNNGVWLNRPCTLTTGENGIAIVKCRSLDNETLETFLTYDYQIEQGSTATAYAPYSNICPITGHTTAVVTRTGKNLLNVETVVQSGITFTPNADGYVTANPTTDTRTWNYANAMWYVDLPSGTYTVTAERKTASTTSTQMRLYSSDSSDYLVAVALNSDVVSASFNLSKPSTIGLLAKLFDGAYRFSITASSSALPFEPYNAQQVTIDLDGTRYGATVDVLTGVMPVDRAFDTWTGADSETYVRDTGSYGYRFRMYYDDAKDVGSSRHAVICNRGAYSIGNTVGTVFQYNKYIYYYPPSSITTTEDFKTWLSTNNVQFVYPLAEPFTVQLTPSQLSLLLGDNNVWADTGNVSVGYRADTKLYIDGKFAELQALILEN